MIFAQMADPQLGFYDFEPELQRLRKAVKALNKSDCQAVIVCGDMMHRVDRESLAIYLREMADLKIPVFYVPGNHDVFSEAALDAYTGMIGPRFYAADLPDPTYRLIVLDTYLWMDLPDSAECLEMDEFLKKSLDEAKAAGQKIIIATHSPVFLDSPEEEETYFNLPRVRRKWLLDLLKDYPVCLYLSGHTHRAFTYTVNGTLFSSSETTGVAFDQVNHGFRRFVLDGDLIHFRTVNVDAETEE